MSLPSPKHAPPRLTTRRILFRIHWIAGLGAGLVLAIVGVTGALIGFKSELLAWLNPHYRIAASGRPALTPDQWIARARAEHPDSSARSVAWSGDEAAVRVRLSEGRGRGVVVAVDPYSGTVLAPERGTDLFETAEDLHRRLAAGAVGKQLVGASTVLLLVMVASGLYLRWPGRARSARAWLKPNLRLRGRALLWNLHAVVGTWLLASYLLAALTGLWWSYDFYRDALNRMAGVEGPMRRPDADSREHSDTPSIDAAWSAFRRAVPGATRAHLALPTNPESGVEIRFQDSQSAHERAWNTVRFDARSGALLALERYVDQPAGRRFMATVFPLHSGSFFGTPGRVVTALASLLMPFFTVSGLWLWWLRRRQARRRARSPARRHESAFDDPVAADTGRST